VHTLWAITTSRGSASLFRNRLFAAAGALRYEGEEASISAAHPLQARPVRVEERIPGEAAHVVEAPVGAPVFHQRGSAPLADAPGGLPAPGAILLGPKARAVAAGALLALVPAALDQLRGLLRRTR
jgi:hypothetical protein